MFCSLQQCHIITITIIVIFIISITTSAQSQQHEHKHIDSSENANNKNAVNNNAATNNSNGVIILFCSPLPSKQEMLKAEELSRPL